MSDIIIFKSELKWLILINNNLKRNYKLMFNPTHNKKYNELWEQYVSINYILEQNGYNKIDIPNEMDYPFYHDYYLSNIKENYTKWYKSNYKTFCDMMIKTINDIDIYINNFNS